MKSFEHPFVGCFFTYNIAGPLVFQVKPDGPGNIVITFTLAPVVIDLKKKGNQVLKLVEFFFSLSLIYNNYY